MVEATQTTKRPRDRSPSFPFISLKRALERLESFEKKFGRHATPASKAGLAWGWKEKSGLADQTLAALKSFGLVKYDGMGSTRQIVLTDEGRNYLRAQQESVKSDIRKTCALRPKVIRKFWAEWKADRPADEVAIDKLVLDERFSDAGARAFLKIYDDTISFAGLSPSDKVSFDLQEDDEGDGDLEGENGQRDARPSPPASLASPSPPPASPAKVHPTMMRTGEAKMQYLHAPHVPADDAFPKAGMRQEVITLDDGDVTLTFPANLTPESFADLKDHLDLFIKKMQRRATLYGVSARGGAGSLSGEDDEAAH